MTRVSCEFRFTGFILTVLAFKPCMSASNNTGSYCVDEDGKQCDGNGEACCGLLQEEPQKEDDDSALLQLALLQTAVQLAQPNLKAVKREKSRSTHEHKTHNHTQCEFLAMVPSTFGFDTNYTLQWLKLEYPAGGASVTSEVSLTEVRSAAPELGNWYNLDIGFGAQVAAEIFGDNLYLLKNRGVAPRADWCCGCCADTLRVYPKAGSNSRDIDLQTLAQQAIPEVGFPANLDQPWDGLAQVTHTFHVSLIDGIPHAYIIALYSEPGLDHALSDAIILVNLIDGTLKPTADGDLSFKLFEKLGTFDDSEDATRFKVQYVKEGLSYPSGEERRSDKDLEQWHMNGITQFTTKAGVTMLAFTFAYNLGVILIKDPWNHKSANTETKILQRFGATWHYKNGEVSKTRGFGLDPSLGPVNMHNVFYRSQADGTESLTVFANSIATDSYSHVFEFQIKSEEEMQEAVGDDVFRTAFSTARFSFNTGLMGGARPLGKGVWIGAGGKQSDVGYQIVDMENATLTYQSMIGVYDPFPFISIH